MSELIDHDPFMERALELAQEAAEAQEVPVGALLVVDGQIVGEGRNRQVGDRDPTAHAEIVAIRAAARALDNYRLPGSTLYVTLEPCAMCCGAMIHARVEHLIFAATEPRAGAVMSTRQLLDESAFNHRVRWSQSVPYEKTSGDLLRGFFRQRRA